MAINYKNADELRKNSWSYPTGGYQITNFTYFCYEGTRLDELDKVDTSKGTIFDRMFFGSADITGDEIPIIDTSNGISFRRMFGDCESLVIPPYFDTSKNKNFREMFKYCPSLTSIPEYVTSNGETFREMFNGCTKLVSIPEIDTSKSKDFQNMFKDCSALVSVPRLDLVNTETTDYLTGMFDGCKKLTNMRLYNITKSITIGTDTYGHLLDVDSIVHTIKELHNTGTHRILTMGSANLSKIANLYCKAINNSTVKIDMELCDSSDPGAMTLAEYAALKEWTFA